MGDSTRNLFFYRVASNETKKEISLRSLQLAAESYKHMVENCDGGDIIIVEQS